MTLLDIARSLKHYSSFPFLSYMWHLINNLIALCGEMNSTQIKFLHPPTSDPGPNSKSATDPKDYGYGFISIWKDIKNNLGEHKKLSVLQKKTEAPKFFHRLLKHKSYPSGASHQRDASWLSSHFISKAIFCSAVCKLCVTMCLQIQDSVLSFDFISGLCNKERQKSLGLKCHVALV